MHTFLNRKLTIFVCLALGGLCAGRAQVQPLPVIPPDELVQTYTGRLAYTLLNGYVPNDDDRLSDSRTPKGAAGGDLTGNYPNPTIKGSVSLTGTPTAPTPSTATNNSRIATTAYVKSNLANYVTTSDARLSDSRTPKDAAGGDLSGNYPNPTIKSSVNLSGSPTTTTPATSDNSTKIATTAYVQNNLANVPVVIAAGQVKRILPTNSQSNWRIISQSVGSATIENYDSYGDIRGLVTVNGMTDDCIVILYGVNGGICLTRQSSNQFEISGEAWGNSYHTNYYTVLKIAQ